MTSEEISIQLDGFSEQLAAAVSERNAELLSQILEVQRGFVTDHLELLDDVFMKRIQYDLQRSLLLAKISRAHCLDAILVNRRKLRVLTAYQAG